MKKNKLWNNFDGYIVPLKRWNNLTPFAYSCNYLDANVSKYHNNGLKKTKKEYFNKKQNKIINYRFFNKFKIE